MKKKSKKDLTIKWILTINAKASLPKYIIYMMSPPLPIYPIVNPLNGFALITEKIIEREIIVFFKITLMQFQVYFEYF